MKDNMADFFNSIQGDTILQSNSKDSSNNIFEVPLPPLNYKDIIINSSDEYTNNMAQYEQYPSTSNKDNKEYPIIVSEQKMTIEINILEELLKEDNYNPMIRFQLIDLYKKMNQIDKLNSIRDQTLQLYPLIEQIWIDWINERRSNCVTIIDQYQLVELYKIAFKDFPYHNLSFMFIEFLLVLSKEEMNEKISGFNKITDEYIRSQFKEIIRIWGLDIDLSSKVYDMYIDFESKSNCSQIDMRAIWRGRLGIPQPTIDCIWEEYIKWDKDNVNEITKSKAIYASTSKNINYVLTVAEKYKSLQNNIQNDNGVEKFISFIQAEIPTMTKLNKNYILLFFEKALEVNFNERELWKMYLSNVSIFNDRSMNLNILKRASRCFPNDVMFVILHLREMEINGFAPKEIEQKINESFLVCQMPSFQYEIWKYYLEFKCRNIDLAGNNHSNQANEIRKLFIKAIKSINQQSEYVDNFYHIWAEFECYKEKDAQMLIDIMNHIVIKESSIHNWRAFIYYIKSVGNNQTIREIYKRAFDSVVFGEKEVIKTNWIGWEKIFGSPKTIDSTVAYTQNIINHFEKELTANNTNHSDNIMPPSSFLIESEEERDNRKIFVKSIPAHYNETDLKQFIFQYSPLVSLQEIRIIRDDNGNSRQFAFIDMASHKDALALVNELNNKPIDDKHIITCAISKPPKEGQNDSRTLFVNNLSYLTTKEKLNEVFGVYGNILDIRLITNQQTGKPRGYGYIEFQNEESIELAINEQKLIEIDGRRIQIQKSQSVNKIRNVIKYVAHVTNLDYKLKESELEQFFIENEPEITNENIIGIKIAKNNNRRSKGFGFVEFDTIKSLTKALALSGKELGNRSIIIKEANNNASHMKSFHRLKAEIIHNKKYLQTKTERSTNTEEDGKELKPKTKLKNKDYSNLFN